MKLSKLFVIAMMVGTLAVFGCGGDDDGDGNGSSPEELCNTGDCIEDDVQREACLEACRLTPGNCEFLARDLCR